MEWCNVPSFWSFYGCHTIAWRAKKRASLFQLPLKTLFQIMLSLPSNKRKKNEKAERAEHVRFSSASLFRPRLSFALPSWGACAQDTQWIVVWYRPVSLQSRGLWEICWSFLGTRHREISVIHVIGVPWQVSDVFRCWISGDRGQVKTAKPVWKACLSETNI